MLEQRSPELPRAPGMRSDVITAVLWPEPPPCLFAKPEHVFQTVWPVSQARGSGGQQQAKCVAGLCPKARAS